MREWITPDAYRPEDDTLRAPRTNAQVGRRPRKQYVGPDGKRGLSLLSPSQAFELAEALTRAAIEAEAMAEAEGVPA